MATKKSKGKQAPRSPAANSDASAVLDDFDVYRTWCRNATNDDSGTSLSGIRAHWDNQAEAHAVSFAAAVRRFWSAENARTAAATKLRDIAHEASAIEQVRGDGSNLLESGRTARRHQPALNAALKQHKAAVNVSIARLNTLDNALDGLSAGEFKTSFVRYHKTLRGSLQSYTPTLDEWLAKHWPTGRDWKLEKIAEFAAFGAEIDEWLMPSTSSAEDDITSNPGRKRKHTGDAEASNGSRSPKKGGAAQNRSAQADAAKPKSQQHDLTTPARSTRLGHQPNGETREDRAAAPHPERPLEDAPEPQSRDQNSGEQGPHNLIAQPSATPEPLPFLPEADEAGPYTQRLRDLVRISQLSYVEWVRRQLEHYRPRTLEIAEAISHICLWYHEGVFDDHDWENEDLIPVHSPPRDKETFFEYPWPVDHHPPNVRRLYDMMESLPENGQDFVKRHMEYHCKADDYAHHIIQLMKDKGTQIDWDAENDLLDNVAPVDATKEVSVQIPTPTWNGSWTYKDVVGEGGNGRAALYYKFDSTGNIVKRVIVKESFIGKRWNARTSWYGPIADRMPFEAGLHELLPKHAHIIEYLGYNVNKQLRMVRIYTAFAQLGDLTNLTINHDRLRDAVDENGQALQPAQKLIPVVAVLYIFEAMAAGACLMAHGDVPNDQGHWPGGAQPQWPHSIVHRDIKPSNYFLAASTSSTVWPGLPVAALGDFGNGFDVYDPAYPRFSIQTRRCGTLGWSAPEQEIDGHQHAVTSAANIYQIGLVVFSLMHLAMPLDQKREMDDYRALFPQDAPFYPPDLVRLAWACLRPEPADRPSPSVLYIEIRRLATQYPDGHHQIPYQFRQVPDHQFVRTGPDRFTM